MNNQIELDKFKKFPNSSEMDSNLVGSIEGRIIRIFRNNIADYKEVISLINSIKWIIKSEIISEEDGILIVEHEKLHYITYFYEWTNFQKVEAAIAVIQIQKKLSANGFYLFDPHAFNITYKNAEPIYFDFGSIKKGRPSAPIWFLKNFCGGFTKDYWDSTLKIGKIEKSIITLRILLSNSPLELLIKIISRKRKPLKHKLLLKLIKDFPRAIKVLKLVSQKIPFLKIDLTNWSDYEQREPALIKESPRVSNFIKLVNRYRPESILDIGANKGAYSKLAIKSGVSKAVCIDLDENSTDILREDICENNLPIWTAKLNLMEYGERPGCYGTYQPAHERLHSDFCFCLAVVHHLCYFGDYSFEQVAERFNRFADKILIVEFIPSNDVHLSGANYKGKDRSWYTTENFIRSMKIYFPKDHEIFESDPSPRVLIKFEK